MQTLTTEAATERVLAGMAWLDEHVGSDWPDRIDLDRLDIASRYHCVCGQVYGDYWDAPLPDGIDATVKLGFDAETDYLAEILTAHWHQAIHARRQVA